MSQRLAIAARRRRRLTTYAWVAAMALVVIVLIYKEQTALLYILATLGITVLLAVVAFADLRGKGDLVSDNDAAATANSSPFDAATGPDPVRSGARTRR